MSDLAMAAATEGEGAFRSRTVVLLIAIGLIGFIGMLVLGAYAPDLRSGRNGGAHALSTGGTGYAALVRLAEATGRNPVTVRDKRMLDTDDLVVLTPENGWVDMTEVMAARRSRPTLLILPKWATATDPDHAGWVTYWGPSGPRNAEQVLAPATTVRVRIAASGGRALLSRAGQEWGMRFAAPRPLQSFASAGFDPLLTDEAGRMVLGRRGDLYILSDPDLLDNRGMATAAGARAALQMLDYLGPNDPTGVWFDVTLNGLGRSPSPLKLAFTPPFLAMTLALVVVLVLVGWQATTRFGPPRLRGRAIAFGKAALVDNAATLVRKAGRERALGARYVQVIRERAQVAFGVPARLRGAAVDLYLDRLEGRGRFTDLATAAANATDRRGVTEAARALHDWMGETRR